MEMPILGVFLHTNDDLWPKTIQTNNKMVHYHQGVLLTILVPTDRSVTLENPQPIHALCNSIR